MWGPPEGYRASCWRFAQAPTIVSLALSPLWRTWRAKSLPRAEGVIFIRSFGATEPNRAIYDCKTTLAASQVVMGTAATRPTEPTRVRTISTATTSELATIPRFCPDNPKSSISGMAAPA